MRHRYPFDALHWLRHKRVDEQAAVVSESATRTARARAEEARAESARHAAEQTMIDVASAEQVRLGQGELRAADLQAAADWHKGAEAVVQAKAEQEQRARDARLSEAANEAAARRALGAASNQAQVIDTHRGDWRAERDAARERTEEEAAAEQWTASHFPARRG